MSLHTENPNQTEKPLVEKLETLIFSIYNNVNEAQKNGIDTINIDVPNEYIGQVSKEIALTPIKMTTNIKNEKTTTYTLSW